MAIEQVLHMNGGEGETSYANNSTLQRNVMLNTKHLLEEAIIKLYCKTLPDCLTVADLGSSSGPNALMAASTIIKVVDATSQTLNREPPMFQIFLNDLFGNDFNTLFKSLPEFYQRLQEENGHKFGQCFISGTPGTFYGRLFPNNSIHFFHSSLTLHFLSQTPKELINDEVEPLNKGAIYITKASPPAVHRAYFEQFQRDFKLFLRSRSEELLPNGGMVLSLVVSDENIERLNSWELIGMALNDMVQENLIEKNKLDSYNVSSYFPTEEEVRQVIVEEGSFDLQRVHKVMFDMVKNASESVVQSFLDEDMIGERLTKSIRAITEPILKAEFGEEIMDELFRRYKGKIIQLMLVKKMERANLVMYMNKNSS